MSLNLDLKPRPTISDLRRHPVGRDLLLPSSQEQVQRLPDRIRESGGPPFNRRGSGHHVEDEPRNLVLRNIFVLVLTSSGLGARGHSGLRNE